MSLLPSAREAMDRYSQVITKLSATEIEDAIYQESYSQIRDELLSLQAEGDYRAFYAPFDWINDHADVVIVGVTPGRQQATEALKAMKMALHEGFSIEDAARKAKQAASFKGTMRTLGARLMDHFRFNEVFRLGSSIELFDTASARAHYTSVLRYPVIRKFKNYSGDARILERPMLKSLVDNYLADELRRFQNAWIVPFGPTAHRVLLQMAASGIIDEQKILGGILHPSGTQWNRYNVPLDLITEDKITSVRGGPAVKLSSIELRTKVDRILHSRSSAS